MKFTSNIVHRTSYITRARGPARAFTLVELLVVIGIISVLIGILLPALGRARGSANSLLCLSNLRQIGVGMTMYANAHKGRLPLSYWSGDGDTSPIGSPNNGATDWGFLILPYLNRNAPSVYNAGGDPAGIWKIYHDKDVVTGPASAANYDSEKTQSYGVHPVLFRFAPGKINADKSYTAGTAIPSAGSSDDGMCPFKLNQIKRQSELLMVADASQFGDTLGPNTWACDADIWRLQGDTTAWCHQWATLATTGESYFTWPKPEAGRNKDFPTHSSLQANDIMIRFRHLNNTTANVLFVDGHAGGFHYKHPGIGGSDLEWRNLLVDDFRDQDCRYK